VVSVVVREHDLDAWVQKTDDLGGLGTPAVADFWEGFVYEPSVVVNTSLDPDGPEYMAQMLDLYREISGRSLNQRENELTELDVDRLVEAINPYDDWEPANRAIHYLRMARVVNRAGVPKGGRVLDMGCGWGLTCEILAQLGLEVVAVDINPKFVELVQRRAERQRLPIEAHCAGFDDFEAEPESFDAVVFYESLHHAVDVGSLVARVAKFLKPGAPLMLAGEPIHRGWWPAWGLRLDPESVYCIRKFGWFESGWSRKYICEVLARNDLFPVYARDRDPSVGASIVASRDWSVPASLLDDPDHEEHWWYDGGHLISNRAGERSLLRLWKPASATRLTVEIINPGQEPLPLRIDLKGRRWDHVLAPGSNEITIECGHVGGRIGVAFRAPDVRPTTTTGTRQRQKVGFLLKRATFE
jgi:ubiquinone/menaquinone biosynthesis C-methylase UbiE